MSLRRAGITDTSVLAAIERTPREAFVLPHFHDQAYEDQALPIAQQALAKLQGSGDIYEAYANYNVGRSLIELGRCDEGLPYIAASQRIQGPRREFREARAKC